MVHALVMPTTDDNEKAESDSLKSSRIPFMYRTEDSVHVTPINAEVSSFLDSSSFTDDAVTELPSQSDLVESTPDQDVLDSKSSRENVEQWTHSKPIFIVYSKL